MKFFIVALITFALLSCSKEKSTTMTVTATPLATQNSANFLGKSIVLDASRSAGDITQYGWALDESSPTATGTGNKITYSPSSSHKGSDFVPIIAIVTNPGVYVFGLTVYDAAGEKSYQTVSVDVK